MWGPFYNKGIVQSGFPPPRPTPHPTLHPRAVAGCGLSAAGRAAQVVHVINSCHLDIGFADSSQGIINRYFDHHFPLAAEEGKQFRSGALNGPHP